MSDEPVIILTRGPQPPPQVKVYAELPYGTVPKGTVIIGSATRMDTFEQVVLVRLPEVKDE